MTPDWLPADYRPAAFSVEFAQECVRETVRKLARCPMNAGARRLEIKDLARVMAEAYRNERKANG